MNPAFCLRSLLASAFCKLFWLVLPSTEANGNSAEPPCIAFDAEGAPLSANDTVHWCVKDNCFSMKGTVVGASLFYGSGSVLVSFKGVLASESKTIRSPIALDRSLAVDLAPLISWKKQYSGSIPLLVLRRIPLRPVDVEEGAQRTET